MTGAPRGPGMAALRRFFDGQVPESTCPLTAEFLHGGRPNLIYRLTGGTSTWVLHRPPLGGLTPSAHDVGPGRRVVDALQKTSLPVARTVTLGEDDSVLGVPFSVVEHLDGVVLRYRDELEGFTRNEIENAAFGLVGALAALHAEVGVADFGCPVGYLRRQVRRWHDQRSRVTTRELPDVEALHAKPAEAVPGDSGASIVQGDARIDDADRGRVRALVGWEMSALGDPLSGLDLHLAYHALSQRPPARGGRAGGALRAHFGPGPARLPLPPPARLLRDRGDRRRRPRPPRAGPGRGRGLRSGGGGGAVTGRRGPAAHHHRPSAITERNLT